MKENDKNKKAEPSEGIIIYAPSDEIRNIEQVISDLGTIRKELQKVAEDMKPIENS